MTDRPNSRLRNLLKDEAGNVARSYAATLSAPDGTAVCRAQAPVSGAFDGVSA